MIRCKDISTENDGSASEFSSAFSETGRRDLPSGGRESRTVDTPGTPSEQSGIDRNNNRWVTQTSFVESDAADTDVAFLSKYPLHEQLESLSGKHQQRIDSSRQAEKSEGIVPQPYTTPGGCAGVPQGVTASTFSGSELWNCHIPKGKHEERRRLTALTTPRLICMRFMETGFRHLSRMQHLKILRLPVKKLLKLCSLTCTSSNQPKASTFNTVKSPTQGGSGYV